MTIERSARTFEVTPAVRASVPVWLGLYGPSGSGKTRSALRVATGIQRVAGGKIGVIDTESNRAKHYAPTKAGAAEPNTYAFEHIDFRPPFDPLDYLAAVEWLSKQGCSTIVIDSMSHEHEGPGGIREQHMLEVDRIAAEWKVSKGKANFPAWNAPKGRRRRAINSMLQVGANIVFCFRGREKEKPAGDRLIELGFMPIAGEEWVFEMTLCALLMPGAGGVPTWRSTIPGESMMIKTVDYLANVTGLQGPLSEEHGEAMARWAFGSPKVAPSEYERLWSAVQGATAATIESVAAECKAALAAGKVKRGEATQLSKAVAAKREQLAGVVPPNDEPPPPARPAEREPGVD